MHSYSNFNFISPWNLVFHSYWISNYRIFLNFLFNNIKWRFYQILHFYSYSELPILCQIYLQYLKCHSWEESKKVEKSTFLLWNGVKGQFPLVSSVRNLFLGKWCPDLSFLLQYFVVKVPSKQLSNNKRQKHKSF